MCITKITVNIRQFCFNMYKYIFIYKCTQYFLLSEGSLLGSHITIAYQPKNYLSTVLCVTIKQLSAFM